MMVFGLLAKGSLIVDTTLKPELIPVSKQCAHRWLSRKADDKLQLLSGLRQPTERC